MVTPEFTEENSSQIDSLILENQQESSQFNLENKSLDDNLSDILVKLDTSSKSNNQNTNSLNYTSRALNKVENNDSLLGKESFYEKTNNLKLNSDITPSKEVELEKNDNQDNISTEKNTDFNIDSSTKIEPINNNHQKSDNLTSSTQKADSRIGACEIVKDEGKILFENGKYEEAKKKYERLIQFVGVMFKSKDGEAHLGIPFRLIAHQNLALCNLKLKKYGECIEQCKEALKLDKNSTKAYLRMAKAYQYMGKLETSKENYEKCLKIDPNLKDAFIGLSQLEREFKNSIKNEKQLFKSWNKKTTLYDDKKDIEQESNKIKKVPNPLGINVWETLIWENWWFWIAFGSISLAVLAFYYFSPQKY